MNTDNGRGYGAVGKLRETASELVSLRDLIRWGVSHFNAAGLQFAQGMPEAIDEAVYLCLHALHLPPDFPDHYFDCRLTLDERLAVLRAYQARIESRKPAAYITREAWFAGLPFYVDERVLIPRSPIAELIGEGFEPWLGGAPVSRLLDLCTGSGCIAIACAMAFESAEVVASDISSEALAVAAINRERHGLEGRLALVRSDLFANIEGRFDLIVSNPPYVPDEEVDALDGEFEHEPALALRGGENGMRLVLPILQQARRYLNDDGILVVELGYSWPILEALLPQVDFYWPEFAHGGEGVFVLTAAQLDKYQADFDALAAPANIAK